jgi:hypothetical protein
LRVEAQRRLELGRAVGLAPVLGEELGEERVRLDAGVVEGDGAAQVRFGRGDVAAVERGEREANANVVAVEGGAERQDPLEGRGCAAGVLRSERELTREEEHRSLIGRARWGAGRAPGEGGAGGATVARASEPARGGLGRGSRGAAAAAWAACARGRLSVSVGTN